jgi:hypothetical protein
MEEMIKKAIENELLRKPSLDFTDKVMGEIFDLPVTSTQKPLIPTFMWVFIGVALSALIAVVYTTNPPSTGKMEFQVIQQIGAFFSSIQLPVFEAQLNISVYVILGACAALLLLTLFDLVLFRKK